MIGSEILVILGRPFLVTANALINCRSGVMKISFENMTVGLNIFHIKKQPLDYDQMNQVMCAKYCIFGLLNLLLLIF